MKARTMLPFLTMGLFVAILGVALREAQLARRSTESLASVLNKEIDFEAAIRDKEKLLSEASQRRSALRARLEELQSAQEQMTSYDEELRILAVAAKPWREIALERDSKLQAMYLEAERRALPNRYAAFVRTSGLSQELAGRFEAQEMAAAERTLDIKATAQAQGLAETDPAVAALLNQSAQDLKTALSDILGPDGYSQLQQYERTLPTRSFVDNLAGELAFTDSPLNAQQAEQLVNALSSANRSYQGGGPAIYPRLENYNALMASQGQAQEPVAWDSIRSQVQSTLSSSQFALLDAAMQDNRTTIQLYNMMQAASDAPMLGFTYYRKAP